MAETPASKFDIFLDRASKIAGILLPVVVAVVGGVYTWNKDNSDDLARTAQEGRDRDQQSWNNTQKQYANLTALVPLLTSKDPSAVATGLDIYASEARAGQAPLDLQTTIERIQNEQPAQRDRAQAASDAGKIQQMASACHWDPDGIYIQVENSTEQLKNGRQLKTLLQNSGTPTVQGVQRVDASPKNTQLRYFFTEENTKTAGLIEAELAKHGIKIKRTDEVNLTPRYLKNCNPPGTFELWIGSSVPLGADGTGPG